MPEPGPPTPWEVTGNHYLAFPCIARSDGSLHRVGAVHARVRGTVEWSAAASPDPAGPPLLRPFVRTTAGEVHPTGLRWERLERWVPSYQADAGDGLRVQSTLCAPPGLDRPLRGAVYVHRIENRGGEDRILDVGIEGLWRWSLHTVLTARSLAGPNRLAREVGGLVLENAAAALAITAGPGLRVTAAGEGGVRDLDPDHEISAANGTPLPFRVERRVTVPASGSRTVAFFFGIGPERDGALAAAAQLRRLGADAVVRQSRLELARLGRTAADPDLARILNRNLLFSYFFAWGRGLDDDRLYGLTSRSPLCREPAAFVERDVLLWSLPALTLLDPELAREALLRAFEQYAYPGGHRRRYLDGTVLEPGFALGHLCAYGTALDRYVRETADSTVLDSPVVQDVIREIEAELLARLHPAVFLCPADWLPSGELADHPLVAFENVLFWAFCEALPRIWRPRDEEDRSRLLDAPEEIASAIWRHATAEVDGLRLLACTADLSGEAAVYDDPGGSLAALPFLGFCDADDPVWRNTMDLLRSDAYGFWLGDRPFPGTASRRHPDSAAVAALASELLGPDADRALDLLPRLTFDDAIAGETYDPDTGHVDGGRYHAAVAGFLAWTLWHALEAS